jgi:signal transduction protein with GAF and PtsI domain
MTGNFKNRLKHSEPQTGPVGGIASITREIAERKYLDNLLSLIVSVISKSTGARTLDIFLADAVTKELALRAVHPSCGTRRNLSNMWLGKVAARETVASNAPVKIRNVHTDPRFTAMDLGRDYGIVSLLSVPVSAEEQVLGAINWYRMTEHDFSRQETETFLRVAKGAGALVRDTELLIMKTMVERQRKQPRLIEKAAAVLAEKKGISRGAACDLILHHDRNFNSSLHKIAEAILLDSKLA